MTSADEVGSRAGAMSLQKALLLLDAFRSSGHTVSVSELAARAGLAKSTAHRLLGQMVESGYLVRDASSYRLSLKAFEVGAAYIHCAPNGLVQIAAPHLGSLFLETRAAISLSVLDDYDIVLLSRLETSRFPLEGTVVGNRTRAMNTAAGKAIAAFSPADVQIRLLGQLSARTPQSITNADTLRHQFDRIRERGVATDHEENRLGSLGVASPVLVGDIAIAAVAATGPVGSVDPTTLGNQVLRTARMIAADFIKTRVRLKDYSAYSPLSDSLG